MPSKSLFFGKKQHWQLKVSSYSSQRFAPRIPFASLIHASNRIQIALALLFVSTGPQESQLSLAKEILNTLASRMSATRDTSLHAAVSLLFSLFCWTNHHSCSFVSSVHWSRFHHRFCLLQTRLFHCSIQSHSCWKNAYSSPSLCTSGLCHCVRDPSTRSQSIEILSHSCLHTSMLNALGLLLSIDAFDEEKLHAYLDLMLKFFESSELDVRIVAGEVSALLVELTEYEQVCISCFFQMLNSLRNHRKAHLFTLERWKIPPWSPLLKRSRTWPQKTTRDGPRRTMQLSA